jgi:selenocysteine lyase/cysteine desulfurase
MQNISKRAFLKNMATASATLPFISLETLEKAVSKIDHLTAVEASENEDFWSNLRKAYRLKPDYINLENGYYSMQSEEVLNGFIGHVREVNYQASYYMRTRQFDDKLAMRQKLATLIGCSLEELAITRNTTESIDCIISGIDWKVGDEAVMAMQDYGAMLDMFKQQARRYGMVNKIISLPNHPKSDEEIVDLYEKAISPKTRLLMVCHIVNITGHILPVKKICDMAHKHGVEVIVDGAHAVAHIDFKINDLGCDYYASSLHKWLGCPLGVGLLYVKKDKIKNIWPLFADAGFPDDDIRKLNHTGTHPVHSDLAIADAIKFHDSIGIQRKEARLRYLQEYWTKQVRDEKGISVNTPADSQRACGIANVGVSNLKPAVLAKTLVEKYKIWTVAIDYANVQGVRVTPHVYTTTEELDAFVKALKSIVA